jgi:isoquinoline 1-oxidoreductase beta subunit
VPAADCRAASSVITHVPSGRTHHLRQGGRSGRQADRAADVKLKDPKDWKLAGKRLARLDTVDKTTGKQVYGMPTCKLPGMLNAAIKDCPVFGGKVQAASTRRRSRSARREEGGAVGDSAVAVVADTWWRAKTALDALPIEWDLGPHAKASSAPAFRPGAEGGLDAPQAAVGNRMAT